MPASTWITLLNGGSARKSYVIVTSLGTGDELIIITDTMENPGRHSHKVIVNEFHRIKREIDEYMGVVQQERLSSVK